MRNRLSNHVKETWERILSRTPTQVNAPWVLTQLLTEATPKPKPEAVPVGLFFLPPAIREPPFSYEVALPIHGLVGNVAGLLNLKGLIEKLGEIEPNKEENEIKTGAR